MEKITSKLTVFLIIHFGQVFLSVQKKNKLSVCRVVFGAEPKDYEVYDFILKNYKNLKFGSSLEIKVKKIKSNPKRLQREEMKLERKTESKKIRELEIQRKFELKQEKCRQKHRGK